MLTPNNNAFEDAFNAGAAPTPAVAPPQGTTPYTPPSVVPDTQTPVPAAAPAAIANPFDSPATAKADAKGPRQTSDALSAHNAGPRVLVEFKQEEPCKGKEWRPKTYFVISSHVLTANSQFSPPVVREAPHLGGFDTGVRRNDWDRGSQAVVERRYSELHELRELLTYQFPGLVIPPLPAKKLSQNVETTLNATDATKLQMYNIEMFLTELARMPEVIFFSFFVSGFFMNARQTFLDVTFPGIQQCLAQFRERQRAIHQCGVRHSSTSDSAIGAMTSATSWLVRGVANYVTKSSPEKSAAAGDGLGGAAGTTVVEDGQNHLSALSGAQREDGERWQQTVAVLQRRQKVLKKSAELYEKAVVVGNRAALQGQCVAETLDACKATVAAVEESSLATLYSANIQFFDDVFTADKAYLDGLYVNVRRRLAFERNAVDAVLDAIDHVQSIQVYAASPSSQETPGRRAALVEYATILSRDLRSDYENRWNVWYRARMQNLCTLKMSAPRTKHVEGVKQLLDKSTLARMLGTHRGS